MYACLFIQSANRNRLLHVKRATTGKIVPLPVAPSHTFFGASRSYAIRKPDRTEISLVMTSRTTLLVGGLLTLAVQPQVAHSQQTGDPPITARPLGDRRTDPGIVPRFKRWKIKFAAPNSQTYARQLDFFKIELGVIGSNRKSVDYASHLSKPAPTTRRAPPDDEKRLYVIQDEGNLRKLDQVLLHNVGIEATERSVMHFFPPELENHLCAIELDYGKKQNRAIQEIVKTVFEIKPRGEGWRLQVVEVQFRPSRN